MKAEVYWIEGPWPGRLAIAARPRGGDWLEDEIQEWKQAGINVIVSCLEDHEEAELDIVKEQECCQAKEIEFIRLPVPDRGVPESMKDTSQVLAQLEDRLKNGRSVAVHCRQGIGRSGLVTACLLSRSGMESKEAFSRIEMARGRPVPDTTEQADWVTRFTRVGNIGEIE